MRMPSVVFACIVLFVSGWVLGAAVQPDTARYNQDRQRWAQEKDEISEDVQFLRSYITMLRDELKKRSRAVSPHGDQGENLREQLGLPDSLFEGQPCKSD